MNLWYSSGAFKAKNIKEILRDAQSAEITHIELSSGLSYEKGLLDVVREAKNNGTHRFLVHNYFPPPEVPFVLNIASRDQDNLRESKDLCRRAMRLAAELGSPFYSVHAGFAASFKPELLGKPELQAASLTAADIDRDKAYIVMIETVRELADYAKSLGLELLIENNVISPKYLNKMPINPLLLTEGSEIVKFFADLGMENVGLLLDVAHLKVSATALNLSKSDFVREVQPLVKCLHLSDNDGLEDQNRPMNKDFWFLPWLKEFKNCVMVVEAYNLSLDVMLAQRDLFESAIG